jgi:hypothetical protein
MFCFLFSVATHSSHHLNRAGSPRARSDLAIDRRHYATAVHSEPCPFLLPPSLVRACAQNRVGRVHHGLRNPMVRTSLPTGQPLHATDHAMVLAVSAHRAPKRARATWLCTPCPLSLWAGLALMGHWTEPPWHYVARL